MTALAQGTSGLALVICFGLLRTRQVTAATLLLIAQSATVAVAAAALHRPELAVAPLLLCAVVWNVRHRSAQLGLLAPPVGGPKLGVLAGTLLAVLCQAQGGLAIPLSILLLGILLAATRPHALLQLIALVVAQNGIVLAACHASAITGGASVAPPLADLPIAGILLAGIALPMPLAGALIAGYPRPAWRIMTQPTAQAVGWARVTAAAALLIGSITVPLDPTAAVFAPLFAFDGLFRAWTERQRTAWAPFGHANALFRSLCIVLAVATTHPLWAWMAIGGAMVSALLPVVERRWPTVTLSLCAAGLALFGLLSVNADASTLGYACLFLGYAMMAALVPALAAPLLVLVLRQGHGLHWTASAATIACILSVTGMLACAIALWRKDTRHRVAWLHLLQAAMVLLGIGTNQPDGRYAAAVLLILLTLTSAACRVGPGVGPNSGQNLGQRSASLLATAGLGGIPPFGVFPALILLVLAVCADCPWLLLPLGAALAVTAPASLPLRPLAGSQSGTYPSHAIQAEQFPRLRLLPGQPSKLMLPSAAWIPLGLAMIIGFCTPGSLAHWLRLLATGPS